MRSSQLRERERERESWGEGDGGESEGERERGSLPGKEERKKRSKAFRFLETECGFKRAETGCIPEYSGKTLVHARAKASERAKPRACNSSANERV